jgi:FixJ family two-component response regulator
VEHSVPQNLHMSPQDSGQPLIAIVDDDPSVLKALGRLIRSAGFEAVTFVSGEDFLARFQQRAFACVVLDIHLGGMSGLDLQAYLADAGIRLPIVFITAHDELVTRERIEQSGQRYLRKPVDDNRLLGAISELLTPSKQ